MINRSFSIMAVALFTLILTACGADPSLTPTSVPSATSTPTPTPTAADSTSTTASAVSPTATAPLTPTTKSRVTGQYQGFVFVVGSDSEITFTIGEQLTTLPLPNDAVLRSSTLTGKVSLDGGISIITIDLHSLRSDQTFRDRYVQRTMFPQDRFATLTIPSVLPLPTGFAAGDEVSAKISGTLTIKGVDVLVPFDVTARDDGDHILILAKTTVTWDQLDLPAPSARSVVSIENDVRVEVLLAVRP